MEMVTSRISELYGVEQFMRGGEVPAFHFCAHGEIIRIIEVDPPLAGEIQAPDPFACVRDQAALDRVDGVSRPHDPHRVDCGRKEAHGLEPLAGFGKLMEENLDSGIIKAAMAPDVRATEGLPVRVR